MIVFTRRLHGYGLSVEESGPLSCPGMYRGKDRNRGGDINEKHIIKVANELGLRAHQVMATVELLEQGATVPFIARYRKETTGSLEEVSIATIRDRIAQLRELDTRRESILNSLEERELITDQLREKILAAETLATLEDIYLPYRPKRRTRATIAREKGLEPLAKILFSQEERTDPLKEAGAFVDPEKGVESADQALAGARDIIAEWANEDQRAREKMRVLYEEKGVFRARVIPGRWRPGAGSSRPTAILPSNPGNGARWAGSLPRTLTTA